MNGQPVLFHALAAAGVCSLPFKSNMRYTQPHSFGAKYHQILTIFLALATSPLTDSERKTCNYCLLSQISEKICYESPKFAMSS